jgi:hypothetical protein
MASNAVSIEHTTSVLNLVFVYVSRNLFKYEMHLNVILKFQFLPHSKHIRSPLHRPGLILYKGKIDLFCRNHTKHLNTFGGQNSDLFQY